MEAERVMQAGHQLRDYPADPRPATVHGGRRAGGRVTATNVSRPLVTIVTVVRNRARTLARAIDSVVAQEYPALEYIVVDGSSTDGTVDVIRRYEHHIDVWISEPDRGISDAFNKGVALARGQIIGLLNSDDWYEAGAVAAAVRALEASGCDIVHGQLQYWERQRKTYLVSGDAALLDRGMTVGHPTVFVRRRCYERFGLFRTDFTQAMDYEWLLRAKVGGARFCFVAQCIANMHSGGLGDRRWRHSQREVARARAIHLPSARGVIPYYSYFYTAVAKGTIRRTLDRLNLGAARRWYHRRLSRITITESKD